MCKGVREGVREGVRRCAKRTYNSTSAHKAAPKVSNVRLFSYAVWRPAVASHTCRVESLLDGNLYLILRPAVLNILDPPARRDSPI